MNAKVWDEQNWPGKKFYGVILKQKLSTCSELFLFCSFLGVLLGGGGGTQKWIQDLCSTGKKNTIYLGVTSKHWLTPYRWLTPVGNIILIDFILKVLVQS